MDEMREFKFTVLVKAANRKEAERVMGERILFDEDYGFPYEIRVAGTVHNPSGNVPFEERRSNDHEDKHLGDRDL